MFKPEFAFPRFPVKTLHFSKRRTPVKTSKFHVLMF
jgi:hypothetical protein